MMRESGEFDERVVDAIGRIRGKFPHASAAAGVAVAVAGLTLT